MTEEFDPEKVERYDGIDVEGLNGAKGWGGGLRVEGDGEIEMVLASAYDKLLVMYRKATPTRRPVMKHQGHPDRCHCVHCRNM